MLLGIELVACPHCRRSGALIVATLCGTQISWFAAVFFLLEPQSPLGMWRTFSVALMTVLGGFVVSTLTLFCFAQAVLGGLTRRAAWLREASGALSLSSGYRLWRRLQGAQSALRSRLSREASAPLCAAREPLAQLLAHFGAVSGEAGPDLFAVFQAHTQCALFEPYRA